MLAVRNPAAFDVRQTRVSGNFMLVSMNPNFLPVQCETLLTESYCALGCTHVICTFLDLSAFQKS